MTRTTDVLVVGAGPAGCAAALQAKRLGLSVELVDETGVAGGLLVNAHLVENYPGLDPMPGRELASRLEEGLHRSGIGIVRARIDSIRRKEGCILSEGEGWSSGSPVLVLATGTGPLRAGLEGEEATEGVYYTVTEIPDPFPSELIVLGGGEAAFDYAMTAASRGAMTTIVVRGSGPRASGGLRDAVDGNARIRILYDTPAGAVRNAHGKVVLELLPGGAAGLITADALLVAVGRRRRHPDTEEGLLVSGGGELLGSGGLFTAGDVRAGRLGQACIAAGQGLMAAALALDHMRGDPSWNC